MLLRAELSAALGEIFLLFHFSTSKLTLKLQIHGIETGKVRTIREEGEMYLS